MRIEKKLPQFNNEKAVIIAAGEQTTKFYLAQNGNIEELAYFRILNPRYSDREGHFKRSGRNIVIGSGSVYEPKKEYVQTKFLNKLQGKIRKVHQKERYDSLYLFMPDFMKNDIINIIPNDLREKVKQALSGNLVDEHPFELLKRIQDEFNKVYGKKVPRKEEARKLLER